MKHTIRPIRLSGIVLPVAACGIASGFGTPFSVTAEASDDYFNRLDVRVKRGVLIISTKGIFGGMGHHRGLCA